MVARVRLQVGLSFPIGFSILCFIPAKMKHGPKEKLVLFLSLDFYVLIMNEIESNDGQALTTDINRPGVQRRHSIAIRPPLTNLQ